MSGLVFVYIVTELAKSLGDHAREYWRYLDEGPASQALFTVREIHCKQSYKQSFKRDGDCELFSWVAKVEKTTGSEQKVKWNFERFKSATSSLREH